MDRAVDADLCGLYWIELIMNRRSWARQIEYLIDLDIEGKADVVARQLEPRMREEFMDVVASARIEIVNAQHLVATFQQPPAEMRADEPGPTCNENTALGQH